MTVPSVNLPCLSSMKAADVLLFLQEWKINSSVTPKKALIPARLLVDFFYVSSSDDVLLTHLQSVVSFATYEDLRLAMSELKLDVRIGDVREFTKHSFLNRFVRGILHVGLKRSLSAEIRDDVFPDLHSLVETTTVELLDCSRVVSWTRVYRTPISEMKRAAGTKTRSSWRSQNLINQSSSSTGLCTSPAIVQLKSNMM
ncbi:hypothetical protein P9112_008211 [Eukaryota sp. TZLM1-RC]